MKNIIDKRWQRPLIFFLAIITTHYASGLCFSSRANLLKKIAKLKIKQTEKEEDLKEIIEKVEISKTRRTEAHIRFSYINVIIEKFEKYLEAEKNIENQLKIFAEKPIKYARILKISYEKIDERQTFSFRSPYLFSEVDYHTITHLYRQFKGREDLANIVLYIKKHRLYNNQQRNSKDEKNPSETITHSITPQALPLSQNIRTHNSSQSPPPMPLESLGQENTIIEYNGPIEMIQPSAPPIEQVPYENELPPCPTYDEVLRANIFEKR